MNIIHRLARILGYLAIVIAIVLGIQFFIAGQKHNVHGMHIGGLSNLLGVISTGAAIAAVAIWILRKIYIEVKKRKIPDYELTRTTLLFLRKHHMLLGWMTIVIAMSHGIYYVLRYPNKQFDIITGLSAWAVLSVLVIIGTILDYQLKERRRATNTKSVHFIIAIVFIVTMFAHVLL